MLQSTSSVLSNGNIYTKCREIILRYFDLVAIFESGSGTFGKTGTNTATLFMRRREDTPSLAEQYENRVNSWFSSNFDYDRVYEDSDLMEKYCNHQHYPLEEYKKFLSGTLIDELLENEIFAEYKKTLDIYSENGRIDTKGLNKNAKDIRTKARSRVKTKTYKNLSESEKVKFEIDTLISFCSAIEKDKLYYFMLSISNQDVLVIKSPTTTTEIKKFLGYEWSDTKGNEGIKYLNVKIDKAEDGEETDDTMQQIKGISDIRTPLFNPMDFDDSTKLNYYIKQNFLKSAGEPVENTIPDSLRPFASFVPLVDMIDFSRTTFDKAIKTQLKNENGEMKIESKYPLVKLGEVAPYVSEKIDFSEIKKDDYISTDNMLQNRKGVIKYSGEVNIDRIIKYLKNDILISNIRPYLKKIWLADKNGGCSNDVIVFRITNKEKCLDKYLFELLSQDAFFDFMMSGNKGIKMPRGDKNIIPSFKIPLPPMDIQKNIVFECETIDKEYSDAQKKIEECKNEISAIMENVKGEKKKISEICKYNSYTINPSLTPRKEFIYVDIESVKNGTGEIVFEKKIFGNNAPSRARRLAKSKSTLVSTVRPNLKGFAYLEDEIENAVYSTGFAIFETADENKLLSKMIYYFFMYSASLMKQMLEVMPKGQYPSINNANIDNFTIPVPSLSEQKKIVEQITALEEQIAALQNTTNESAGKKSEILKKWLE